MHYVKVILNSIRSSSSANHPQDPAKNKKKEFFRPLKISISDEFAIRDKLDLGL